MRWRHSISWMDFHCNFHSQVLLFPSDFATVLIPANGLQFFDWSVSTFSLSLTSMRSLYFVILPLDHSQVWPQAIEHWRVWSFVICRDAIPEVMRSDCSIASPKWTFPIHTLLGPKVREKTTAETERVLLSLGAEIEMLKKRKVLTVTLELPSCVLFLPCFFLFSILTL